MITIRLDWKEYEVQLDKVQLHLKVLLSENYDGLIATEAALEIVFLDQISEDDETSVADYWDNITEASFNPTLSEIIADKLSNAIAFGNDLIVKVSVENITLGITQVGKTKVVLDYLSNLQMYLRTGSLYAALEEIDNLINDPDRESLNLAPYVTTARLNTYKTKITEYLES